MRSTARAGISTLLGCIGAFGQSQHVLYICALSGPAPCYPINTSVMGGVRHDDYKITNPGAVQFDPAQRLKELAALGPSTANTMCAAPPSFTTPAPTITFTNDTVHAQIYYMAPPASFSPSEFMAAQFADFTPSNGYKQPNVWFHNDPAVGHGRVRDT